MPMVPILSQVSANTNKEANAMTTNLKPGTIIEARNPQTGRVESGTVVKLTRNGWLHVEFDGQTYRLTPDQAEAVDRKPLADELREQGLTAADLRRDDVRQDLLAGGWTAEELLECALRAGGATECQVDNVIGAVRVYGRKEL